MTQERTGDACAAVVFGTYSTGDLADGMYPSADWSGAGRELRLLYTFWCDCGHRGALRETLESAEQEALAHTSVVTVERRPITT